MRINIVSGLRVFFIAVGSVVYTKTFAQNQFGLSVGVNNNRLIGSAKNNSTLNYTTASGSLFGLFTSFPIGTKLILTVEPEFIKKNYRKNSLSNPNVYEDIHNMFVQLPIGLRKSFFFMRNLNSFVDIGCYEGYWLTSKETGQIQDLYNYPNVITINQKIQFNNRIDNRYETGLILGFGETLNFGFSNLSIRLSLAKSLTSQQKKYSIDKKSIRNETYSLQLIYCLSKL